MCLRKTGPGILRGLGFHLWCFPDDPRLPRFVARRTGQGPLELPPFHLACDAFDDYYASSLPSPLPSPKLPPEMRSLEKFHNPVVIGGSMKIFLISYECDEASNSLHRKSLNALPALLTAPSSSSSGSISNTVSLEQSKLLQTSSSQIGFGRDLNSNLRTCVRRIHRIQQVSCSSPPPTPSNSSPVS